LPDEVKIFHKEMEIIYSFVDDLSSTSLDNPNLQIVSISFSIEPIFSLISIGWKCIQCC
jgi:hypothetical protein